MNGDKSSTMNPAIIVYGIGWAILTSILAALAFSDRVNAEVEITAVAVIGGLCVGLVRRWINRGERMRAEATDATHANAVSSSR